MALLNVFWGVMTKFMDNAAMPDFFQGPEKNLEQRSLLQRACHSRNELTDDLK